MPPVRKGRSQHTQAQAQAQAQYESTIKFNTFINVSIPKAPQVLSPEALEVRPMIPAKTPSECPFTTASAFFSPRKLALGELKDNSHTRKKPIGHINRPPNAFILFRRAQCSKMSGTAGTHQQRISNLVATFWRSLTEAEQSTWYELAGDIKEFHQLLFPDYQFIPHPQNATEEEKHRKTNLRAQAPHTAEQDVVIEERMRAYIFRHAGAHVDLSEVDRLQKLEESALSSKKSKRRQKPKTQTQDSSTGSTFVFDTDDSKSIYYSEGTSQSPSPRISPLEVAPIDVGVQPQFATSEVKWNPNYSLMNYGGSTSTNDRIIAVGPFDTLMAAPSASTAAVSPSMAPSTPEHFFGYIEPPSAYGTGLQDSPETHTLDATPCNSTTSLFPVAPATPVVWNSDRYEPEVPVVAQLVQYPYPVEHTADIQSMAYMNVQPTFDVPQGGIPYRFSVQFREWIVDDAWSRHNSTVDQGKFPQVLIPGNEVHAPPNLARPYPVYPPTYVLA